MHVMQVLGCPHVQMPPGMEKHPHHRSGWFDGCWLPYMRVNDCMSCKYVCKTNTSRFSFFYMSVLMVNIRIHTYTHPQIYSVLKMDGANF